MDERERIDRFNRDLDAYLTGKTPPPQAEGPDLLTTARRLAKADFSTHSQRRVDTRDRLVARHMASRRKLGLNRQAFAWAVFLLALVGGLSWVLANTLAQPTVPAAPEQLSDRMIVYQVDQEGNAEIYRMDGDGSQKTNLTRHPAQDTAPAWSPDGQRIAFLSDRSGKPEIYVMDESGEQVRQLTDSPETNWYLPLAWSPDGATIALTGSARDQDENHARIYIVDAADPGASRFLNTPPAKSPRWLDDNLLIFHSFDPQEKSSLYVVDLETGSEQRIAPPDDSAGTPSMSIVAGFDSSPDGRQVAYLALQYESNPDNPNLNLPAGAVINIYDRAAGTTRTLMDIQPIPNGIHSLLWSPEGRYLAYLQDEKNNGCWTVHLLRPDNPAVTELEDLCFTMRTLDPGWTRDGEWLLFPADEDGSFRDYGLVAVHIPGLIENPEQPRIERLTGADGTAINPQVRP